MFPLSAYWTLGKRFAESQSLANVCQHGTEVGSDMQAAHQRLDQPEETGSEG